ncbi:hypothetical protein [Halogranum amylolyticum]|uniref:hypothetical protein n=1 Tax=Halogranum amylolyticum TaxID=660520 RepID=UPI001B8CB384|nr:hypothetical protein [Halogranum amylolyticum]
MDRVRDAVAGGRKPDSPLLAGTSQKEIIVGVLVVLLEEIVVHVLGRELGLEVIDVHGFELEHDNRAGDVLGQRLIDVQCDFFTRLHPAINEVVFDEFLCDSSWYGLRCDEYPLVLRQLFDHGSYRQEDAKPIL